MLAKITQRNCPYRFPLGQNSCFTRVRHDSTFFACAYEEEIKLTESCFAAFPAGLDRKFSSQEGPVNFWGEFSGEIPAVFAGKSCAILSVISG
jgi:hypothetical protein